MLKSVAASLQRERDVTKIGAAKAEQENRSLSSKVADLEHQLSHASSQIRSLSKDGGSPRHKVVSKGEGKADSEAGTCQQQQAQAEANTTLVSQADAHGASLTPDQVMNGPHLLACWF